jgi:F-type H+-transporting ATPase subunit beta
VPADDFTDPSAVHTFSHLSASIVLSRQRASEGLSPAIDPLQSSSKMGTLGIVGERHYRLAQEIRRTLAQYAGLKDIIAMLGAISEAKKPAAREADAKSSADAAAKPAEKAPEKVEAETAADHES